MIYLKITEPSGFLTTMVPLLCTIIVLQQYSTTLSPFSAHSHIPSWFDMVLVGPRVTSVEAKLCRKKNLKERRKPPFLLQLYLTTTKTKHLERRSAEKERKGFIAFNLQKHTHSRLQLTLIYLSAPLLSRFSLASFGPNFGDNSGSQ